MYIEYLNNKDLNVAVGDLVSIQGNLAHVTGVYHGRDRHNGHKAFVNVHVKFVKENGLSGTIFDNSEYGLFRVIEKGGK